MIGRAAYHYPYRMASFDARFYGEQLPQKTPAEVVHAMLPYMEVQIQRYGRKAGGHLRMHHITRHMLGLMAGLPGARRFRQILSDPKKLETENPQILLEALSAVKHSEGAKA